MPYASSGVPEETSLTTQYKFEKYHVVYLESGRVAHSIVLAHGIEDAKEQCIRDIQLLTGLLKEFIVPMQVILHETNTLLWWRTKEFDKIVEIA